ncbi:hypothetical protein SU69_06340 [Thermosipho melanesiensis]|uniref:Response regulator receiver and SARP domain protein n=2 Tax=Thermosipho melanesiensis TaxID=46541 RepID=A6LMF0_THEM4|nr:transcriptional regulator [Thermosipho melanesiensis]ABR31101.1 response regulator receiver and SARP domain protein [Thermosipho melanesiensis BI429]APT74892.1 hypothetical protein BW47_06640 [Thermosipho melanesiensis]OOC36139.1 hypothetical protein SU68_06410 [Thermosipho melanesiensis]OOC36956.1 hypothetical protein SU69_06340 [Thermosipho melanesiensis]OOC37708.1 hypothetical protein SU70_06350 [Thermosipho melanesiensis]
MYIQTFGDFKINGKFITLSKKEIELLVYSIIKNPYATIENLIENVWAGFIQPSRNDVGTYFSKINKKINEFFVRLRIKNGKVIVEGKVELDTKLFEKNSRDFLNDNLKLFDKILELYKGPFLGGIDSVWVENYREYFEELFFEMMLVMIKVENNASRRLKILGNLVNLCLDLEKVNDILNFVRKIEFSYQSYVNRDIFDYLYEKDKNLRHSRYIKLILKLKEANELLFKIRRGDVIYKESDKIYYILLETSGNDVNTDIKKFSYRLVNMGVKIKYIGIVN